MITKNRNRKLFASGLLSVCASLVLYNFNMSHAAQGFLLGLGFVLTVYGFISIKRMNKSAC